MTLKPIVSIPHIPATPREQADSRKKETANCPCSPRHVTSDSKRVTQLQPITGTLVTKLPPLKESLLTDKGDRLPDIAALSGPVNKPKGSHARTACKSSEVHPKLTDTAYVQAKEVVSKNTGINVNTEISNKDKSERHPGCINRDGVQRYSCAWQKKETRPEWFEERDKLRQNRKQAERKQAAPLKPLKATRAFKEKAQAQTAGLDRSKVNKIYTANEADIRSTRETGARLQSDDNNFRNVTDRYTKGTSTTAASKTSRDSSRAGALTPFKTRGTECSKKGVGFRSKSRLAQLRAEEESRIEKERIEREQREARIPKQIRKNFVKYGFR